MSTDGQNIDNEALYTEHAGRCQQLTDLECQSLDPTGIQLFAGLGAQGMQNENIQYCAANFTGTIPTAKTDFAGVNHGIATLACEFNNTPEMKLS